VEQSLREAFGASKELKKIGEQDVDSLNQNLRHATHKARDQEDQN
jgi:phage terminase Nu1 subunit (DNA packaging protein)